MYYIDGIRPKVDYGFGDFDMLTAIGPKIARAALALAIGSGIALCSGCYFIAPQSSPIPTIRLASDSQRSDTLVVMLPGFGDRDDIFIDSGFIDSVENPPYDIVAVDAHFGYYRKRTLVTRLESDVIAPAIRDGYRRIWLAGVSMGGLGALLYASQRSEQISGVVLLGPFLGDDVLIEEVRSSGGLRDWNGEFGGGEPYQQDIWRWLQSSVRDGDPKVVIAYGDGDDAAVPGALLADALPESQTYVIAGGHNWTTWNELWRRINSSMQF